MNTVYKALLASSSTFWLVIVFLTKEKFTIMSIPYQIFDIMLALFVIIISWLTLKMSKYFGIEQLSDAQEITLSDSEFLPTYLGYFFVGLSIPSDMWCLVIVYSLVLIFTYLSSAQYFNPVYLLFGYHFYKIKTINGTNIFVVVRGKIIRNNLNIDFKYLRRINDTTFINYGKD